MSAPAVVERTLRARRPFAGGELLAFLALRAVPGVEHVAGDTYARTLRLPGGPGVVLARVRAASIAATAIVSDASDADAAFAALRRIFDLAADPVAIDAALGADALLAPMVAARPGLRSPGVADGAELLVRAIAGQQVSVAGARTTLGRIAAAHGEPLGDRFGHLDMPQQVTMSGFGLERLFPSPARLAEADPAALGMPRARGAAIVGASAACADGLPLHREALLALPGVGPWTADYVAMRALGDPDAFLASDLGVRHALQRAGADGSPKAAAERAQAWRPYRAYANHHLWATL